MLTADNPKSVTGNVGWSGFPKTSTFGLKFVTVPIQARSLDEFGTGPRTAILFPGMVGSADPGVSVQSGAEPTGGGNWRHHDIILRNC